MNTETFYTKLPVIPVNAYQRRTKFHDLTDEEALRLVRMIKMSSDNNGMMIMKSLRNTIKKDLQGRRTYPKFKKVEYKWDL